MARHHDYRLARVLLANGGALPTFLRHPKRQPRRVSMHATGSQNMVFATKARFNRSATNRRRKLAHAAKRRNR